MALLVLALAVTATKLNTLRADKAHTDPLHCYNQTGGGEEKSTERIYDEVGEGKGPIGEQKGHYQELKLRQWIRNSMKPCMEDTRQYKLKVRAMEQSGFNNVQPSFACVLIRSVCVIV